MTMVDQLRSSLTGSCNQRVRVAAYVALCIALGATAVHPLRAQIPAMHYRHSGDMPPGAIGSAQLERGGPLPGYFQPVEIRGPAGSEVALAADGRFLEARPAPVHAGLLIAPVYRLRVTRIPLHAGAEVFPTIEVIDRIYPPVGEERRFPIVVELTQQDLELALAGNFVTRVVYLEDPETALPVREQAEQNWFDAGIGDDALQVADSLGRPVAILRLGGRVPLDETGELDLRNDCAPLLLFRTPGLPSPLQKATGPNPRLKPVQRGKAVLPTEEGGATR